MVVSAAVIGTGALVLPVPEQIEIDEVETPAPSGRVHRVPGTPSSPSPRASRKPVPPAPKQKPAPAPPAAKAFPMQDTTKTRTLVQPAKPQG